MKWFVDFQEFMVANNVLAIATGWGIGQATKDFISRLVIDVITPFFVFVWSWGSKHPHIAAFWTNVYNFGIMKVIIDVTSDFLLWLMFIVVTFVMLEYVLFRKILGVHSVIKKDDLQKFNGPAPKDITVQK
jgi:large-conductance mechanosensitive channel